MSFHFGMKDYKTPERARVRAKERREAVKVAGGEAYAALLEKERQQRKKWRADNRDKIKAYERRRPGMPFKTWLCANARFRGRKRGLEATIMPGDLAWPEVCPVLGIRLDYPERSGMRKDAPPQPNWPSLDRWDSGKGYVPGNVFVISYRANTLKNNATLEEYLLVADYLRSHPAAVRRAS